MFNLIKLKSKFTATLFAVWISKISHVVSFYCIWKRWTLSVRGTCCYWLSITYFILLRVFCFFLIFSCFLIIFVSSIICKWKRWMLPVCGAYCYWLANTYFILLRVFCYFLFFSCFLVFFVSSITCWGIEVSLTILKIKQWSCS